MNGEADKLLQLAKQRFTNLSPAEDQALTKLCRDVVTGKISDFSTKDENANNPVSAASWPAERLLKAEWFVWLCMNPQAAALVTHKGFHVKGAIRFSIPLCIRRKHLSP